MMQRIFGAVLSIMLLGSSSAALAGGGPTVPLIWPMHGDEHSQFTKDGTKGIFLQSAPGTGVYAIGRGEVAQVNCSDDSCRVVVQYHLNGIEYKTVYAGMSESKVVVGQSVTSATQVGTVGSTARVRFALFRKNHMKSAKAGKTFYSSIKTKLYHNYLTDNK